MSGIPDTCCLKIFDASLMMMVIRIIGIAATIYRMIQSCLENVKNVGFIVSKVYISICRLTDTPLNLHTLIKITFTNGFTVKFFDIKIQVFVLGFCQCLLQENRKRQESQKD